jgi:hypothetical protein
MVAGHWTSCTMDVLYNDDIVIECNRKSSRTRRVLFKREESAFTLQPRLRPIRSTVLILF